MSNISATGFISNREKFESLFRDDKRDVIRACREGDLEALNVALTNGGDPLSADADGHPVLLLAADRENGLELVRTLLKAGAKPDVANARGITALMAAARRTDTAMMQVLFEAGASADAVDRAGLTAMEHVQRFAASGKGKAGLKKLRAIALLVEAVVRKKDDPSYEYQGLTALHWAAMADDVEMMDRLLQFGAEPFRAAKDGTTVMEKAYPNKAARNVMFRELAIQFRSDLEHLRKAGSLNTSKLIDFFEKKRMKSPGGFSLWSLSEVQPVLDFLNEKDKGERMVPALGKRQIQKFEQMAALATLNPSLAASLSERVKRESEITTTVDIVTLRLAGLPDDLILAALQRKSRTAPNGFDWRGDEVESLTKKYALGFKRCDRDFLAEGAADVIAPVAGGLRDAGMLTKKIAELLVEYELFPRGYLRQLEIWLYEHFDEPYLEAA